MKVGDLIRHKGQNKRMGVIVNLWAQRDFGNGEPPCNTVVVLHTDTGEEKMYNSFELEIINESR